MIDVATMETYSYSLYVVVLTVFISLLCTALFISLLPPHKKGFLFGKQYVMPPGPRGEPFFGSLRSWLRARNSGRAKSWVSTISRVEPMNCSLTALYPQHQVMEQARHGELATLSMGTKTWVLINSGRMLNEIFAKRTKYTHERPYLPIVGGLVSRDLRPFLKSAADWKDGRRLVHQFIMGAPSANHGPIVEDASLGLLRAYLDEPDDWYAHHYRYAIAIVYKVITNNTIGKSKQELNDLQEVTISFIQSISKSMVDFFPQLSLLPKFMQPWRPQWEKVGTFHYNVFKHWWTGMKGLTNRDAEPSFLDSVISEFSGTEDEAMYLIMAVMAAGSDNTRITMHTGIAACVAYPEAIQRAREELDRLCGTESLRLPTLDDMPDLPYTCALVKEALRWRPVVPLLPPRVLTEDLAIEGYHLPAGTEFMVNMLAVNRQGREKAADFYPERWLDQPGIDQQQGVGGDAGVGQGLWHFAFAAGKRSCVGYKLAQKEIFLAFARLFYCFDILPVGEFDAATKVDTPGIGAPFPIKATVRSPAHERMIRDASQKCTLWGQD